MNGFIANLHVTDKDKAAMPGDRNRKTESRETNSQESRRKIKLIPLGDSPEKVFKILK